MTKPLNRQQAIKFTIEEMRKSQRKHAVGYNTYIRNHDDIFVRDYEHYVKFDQAIVELEAIGRQTVMEI